VELLKYNHDHNFAYVLYDSFEINRIRESINFRDYVNNFTNIISTTISIIDSTVKSDLKR